VNVNTANALTLYALVCSGAPQEILCTDPSQMQLFVMAVTMAQGITMGAPLFGSPADFITAVKGKGMLGPLLTTIGVKPVTKFQSESDFSKSIATESKVFSLYAVGVVKGFKRETRVKIHAVVDFRAAPVVTVPTGSTATPPGGTAAAPAPAASTTPGQDINSIAAALQPNVGGQVLYYTIE
jgi:general secretion pathway protein K